MSDVLDLLDAWLNRQLEATPRAWLDERRARLAGPHTDKDLYVAVGLVPRALGKADLSLSPEDRAEATRRRPGWEPLGLSVDQAARLALVLTAAHRGEAFHAAFHALWRTADVGEQVTFYKGLPLYAEPERYLWRATDGCRTSIRAVFEAIAHRNPYAAERFDEVAWNQLCLKALFVGATLDPILGLDARHNPPLARMMADYAFERWAASRPVSWELWRCVGPFPDARALEALRRAVTDPEPQTRAAATLAAGKSHVPEARELVHLAPPAVRAALEAGTLTWNHLVQTAPV